MYTSYPAHLIEIMSFYVKGNYEYCYMVWFSFKGVITSNDNHFGVRMVVKHYNHALGSKVSLVTTEWIIMENVIR